MIYTVTFNPALDYMISLDRLVPGALNRMDREQWNVGGKGINVSRVLHNLGHESTAWGFIAGFTGKEIRKSLEKEGICTDFIELRKGNSRINVKVRAEEETELNASGPEITPSALTAMMERLDLLREGDYLVLAGSIPGTMPDSTYERIMQRLQKRSIRILVDATGELLKKTLPYRPFLIKPNQTELSELCGRKLVTREEITEAAKKLKAEGAENVLVSMAGEGAILIDENGQVHDGKAARGTAVYSVGAGDSMVAGFLAGYLESGDYDAAFQMGIAAGSASAFSGELADREEVEKLLSRAAI